MPVSADLPDSPVIRKLAIDPRTPSTLYVGTNLGVFKSTNRGAYWRVMNNGLSDTYVRDLVINPITPTILYASTDNGVYKIQQEEFRFFLPVIRRN